MKKNKILVVGLIGLLIAAGLVLAGCKDSYWTCSNKGTCSKGAGGYTKNCTRDPCIGNKPPTGLDTNKCDC